MPALATRMSKRSPTTARTCPASLWAPSGAARSAVTESARPPALRMSATTEAASLAPRRECTRMWVPASARASALARPMPRDAPVTRAVFINLPGSPSGAGLAREPLSCDRFLSDRRSGESGAVSAVDSQDRARHVRRLGAGQEGDTGDDLLR